ncbi:MAG: haloacid dehalogenase-like hydrolase [Myxococcaceae bacterium]|nr:haloacid dehalogenase-like hydrolase [Myxococcaceae bacterium]MCI0669723.1 haloacid dehalogenase-like hydrolase [Myxococcaceae bacterium]
MKPTVLLFDIDGTLVTTGGVGRIAMERAFEATHGRRDACSGFRMDGMTDRGIVRTSLDAIGVPVTSDGVEAVLSVYVSILEEEVARADPRTYRLHPGMAEAVDAALALTHVAVGLGTGNIREGARVKLTRVSIYDRFRFGGFGCDDEDRPTLIRRGAERGAAQLGVSLEACRVVIIGDTPKDVAAAQALGAESIGVGTGRFTPEELLACGATHAFPDLGAGGALQALLGPA